MNIFKNPIAQRQMFLSELIMQENKIFDKLHLQMFNDFEPFIIDGCGEIIIDNFNYKVGNRHYFLSRFGGILIADNHIYHLYRDKCEPTFTNKFDFTYANYGVLDYANFLYMAKQEYSDNQEIMKLLQPFIDKIDTMIDYKEFQKYVGLDYEPHEIIQHNIFMKFHRFFAGKKNINPKMNELFKQYPFFKKHRYPRNMKDWQRGQL